MTFQQWWQQTGQQLVVPGKDCLWQKQQMQAAYKAGTQAGDSEDLARLLYAIAGLPLPTNGRCWHCGEPVDAGECAKNITGEHAETPAPYQLPGVEAAIQRVEQLRKMVAELHCGETDPYRACRVLRNEVRRLAARLGDNGLAAAVGEVDKETASINTALKLKAIAQGHDTSPSLPNNEIGEAGRAILSIRQQLENANAASAAECEYRMKFQNLVAECGQALAVLAEVESHLSSADADDSLLSPLWLSHLTCGDIRTAAQTYAKCHEVR